MSNFFTSLLKGELRTFIALGVLLLVLASLSFATGENVTYKFDFGDGQGIASGYLPVDGNVSPYPVVSGEINYGWSGGVIAKSHGAAVSDLRLRDSNTSVTPATFKVTGLPDGAYGINLVTGDLTDSFSTLISIAGQSYVVSAEVGNWETFVMNTTVTDGELSLILSRSGADLWGINALTISSIEVLPEKPTFDLIVNPNEHTINAGGTAVYKVAVTPLNNYANNAQLSITGLLEGMTAQFIPASGQPPFNSDLKITTSDSNVSTHYDFVITAKGDDPDVQTINRTIKLIITDTLVYPDQPDGPVIIPDKPVVTEPVEPTLSEAAEIQRMMDQFASKVQDEKLANRSEIQAIEDISYINDVWLFTEYPVPETTTEATLLYLTEAGMIQSVVDTAPPTGLYTSPEEAPGFFKRLFGIFVNPAQ